METNFYNWLNFKQLLTKHPDKHLQFRYTDEKMVNEAYHITEVKQAPITSVDCGGKLNSWTEIVIQLWEPGVSNQQRSMKVEKAISIIELVERKMFLDPQAIVKIEFGNALFDMRQMYPAEFLIDNGSLIVNLVPGFTQCKAISRGGSCGTKEECCTIMDKQEVEIPVAELPACCTPGGGCC